jgi:hypothetical protein
MAGVKCGKCGAELGPVARRRAFISLMVYGDEETRSWFFCEACRAWMVEEYYDRFMGDSTVTVRGPFPEEACAGDVALARTCPEPGDKWCECAAHKKMAP